MTHLDTPHTVALMAAALMAGAINAIAGGGSLLSFPTLLYAGYPAVTANIANTLGLLPGYLGGSLGYRAELRGQADRLRLLVPVSVAAAVAGAALLVAGPASLFERLVPWLMLGSCGLILVQPRLRAWVARRHEVAGGVRGRGVLLGAQTASGIYGAYFGAGLGVVMLAVLGVFIDDDLQHINALKGMLSLVINLVAVICFLIFGSIAWEAVVLMAPLSFVGGRLGVLVARRLEEAALRWFVVAFGAAVGVRLLL